MKHTIKLLVLLAAVLCTVACEPTDQNRERTITYTVKGKAAITVHLTTEAEWQALLDRFCEYAESGSAVTFYDAAKGSHGKTLRQSKEATTFSTTSREEMKRWMARMEEQGMTVTVTYDSQTGTWNGTAYAVAPPPMPEVFSLVGIDHPTGSIILTVDLPNRRAYLTCTDGPGRWTPYGSFDDVEMHGDTMLTATARMYLDNTKRDTMWFTPLGGDTVFIRYQTGMQDYSGTHYTNSGRFVPAPASLQTWYCDTLSFDIVLHLYPGVVETLPEQHVAQSSGSASLSCLTPFIIDDFFIQPYYTTMPGMDWELKFVCYDDDGYSYGVVDSLAMKGDFNTDTDVTIFELTQHQFQCTNRYPFHRVK